MEAFEAMNASPEELGYEYGRMMNEPKYLRSNLVLLSFDTTALDREIN